MGGTTMEDLAMMVAQGPMPATLGQAAGLTPEQSGMATIGAMGLGGLGLAGAGAGAASGAAAGAEGTGAAVGGYGAPMAMPTLGEAGAQASTLSKALEGISAVQNNPYVKALTLANSLQAPPPKQLRGSQGGGGQTTTQYKLKYL